MPKSDSLKALLAQAEHYANFSMRKFGNLPPTLFVVGAEGRAMLVPENLADERAKNDFATSARLFCVAHAATACVMVMEAWAKFAKPYENLDLMEPPSESFDREEFVILMGETKQMQKQIFLPIIRTGIGGFFGFGEPKLPKLHEMQGRFAQILPPKIPDEPMRELAKALLKARNTAPTSKPPKKRQNRFR